MREISVFKAQPLVHDEPVESVQLRIDAAVPDSPSLEHSGAVYRTDAARILGALSVLPQGTWYELLKMMLAKAPVMYRGPFEREGGA